MGIVVDDQDAPAPQIGLEEARSLRCRPPAKAGGKLERAALAHLALDGDMTAHELGELLGNRQSKAGAAIFAGGGGVGLLERLEQTLDFRLGHAEPGGAHRKLHELAVGTVLQNANLN